MWIWTVGTVGSGFLALGTGSAGTGTEVGRTENTQFKKDRVRIHHSSPRGWVQSSKRIRQDMM